MHPGQIGFAAVFRKVIPRDPNSRIHNRFLPLEIDVLGLIGIGVFYYVVAHRGERW
jgi:hypothetical protein